MTQDGYTLLREIPVTDQPQRVEIAPGIFYDVPAKTPDGPVMVRVFGGPGGSPGRPIRP